MAKIAFRIGLLAGAAMLVAAVAILRRRITIVAVYGHSMQPALRTGDRVLVRRAHIGDLRHGQIVVFEKPSYDGTWDTQALRWPADNREWLIKRVAALPGDPQPEAIPPAPGSTWPVVPDGKFAVLGDNAARSLDSRKIGYIPAERLLGVMLRPITEGRPGTGCQR